MCKLVVCLQGRGEPGQVPETIYQFLAVFHKSLVFLLIKVPVICGQFCIKW